MGVGKTSLETTKKIIKNLIIVSVGHDVFVNVTPVVCVVCLVFVVLIALIVFVVFIAPVVPAAPIVPMTLYPM